MSDIYGYSEDFPMEETLCKNCIFMMSRVITPINLETFGLDESTVSKIIEETSEDDIVQIEQHTCLVNQQDMDFVVLDCSHFKSKEASLLKNIPF